MDFLTFNLCIVAVVLLIIQYAVIYKIASEFNKVDSNTTIKELLINSIPFVMYITMILEMVQPLKNYVSKIPQRLKNHVLEMLQKDRQRKVNIILKKYESHECHGWARPMIAAYLYEDRNKLSKLMIQFSLDEDEFLEYLSETTANEIDDLKLFLANEKVKMIDNKLTGAYQNY
jgi:hypothetical protein